jgi:hypothetical protein
MHIPDRARLATAILVKIKDRQYISLVSRTQPDAVCLSILKHELRCSFYLQKAETEWKYQLQKYSNIQKELRNKL